MPNGRLPHQFFIHCVVLSGWVNLIPGTRYQGRSKDSRSGKPAGSVEPCGSQTIAPDAAAEVTDNHILTGAIATRYLELDGGRAQAHDEFAEFLSIAEAAEQYKVTRAYWYDMAKATRIKAYELPGRRGMFLKKQDIVEFWKPRQVDVNRDNTSV
jgi:excisionase family DNA binding protein